MGDKKAGREKAVAKPTRGHKLLKERLAKYKGNYIPHEWDTGISVGKEV